MHKDWVDGEGTAASVNVTPTRGGNNYGVVFTYKVNDSYYGGTYNTSEETRVGDAVYFRYDPNDPERNTLLEQEKWKRMVLVVFGVIFACFLAWNMLR